MQINIYLECNNPDYRVEGDTLIKYKEPSREVSILLRDNTNEARKNAVFFAYLLLKNNGDIPYLDEQSIRWAGTWPIRIPHQIMNYSKFDYDLDSNGIPSEDSAENWRLGIIRRQRIIPPDKEKTLKIETYGTTGPNIPQPQEKPKNDTKETVDIKIYGIALLINNEIKIAKF